jgi:iron complex transport system substrate-binding protein
MRDQWSRRGFFGVASAAAVFALAACGGEKKATGASGGSVTIKHKFGETTVPAPPKRVVSAGFTEQDDLLALGVVPVAVTNWWGDQPFAVWRWAQPKLGSTQPTMLSLADGLQFDQIAALKPDLIVATNAGVDQDSYNRLSAIAPTIPQSSDEPFFEPWKTQAKTIAQAVSQSDQMNTLISGVDNKFADVAKNNSSLKDKKVLQLQGTFYQDNVIATLPGWRTDYLTQMGLVIPDSIKAYAKPNDSRAFIPRNQLAPALDAADALIWTTESDADQAALLADPNVMSLKASRANKNVFTGKDLSGAIAFSSPLSLPVVADQLPPMLTKVLT